MPITYRSIYTVISMSVALLAGCQTSLPTRPVAELPPGVAGIWKSNGYGYIIDVTETYPRLFHYTPEFCIEDKESAAALSHYMTPENLSYGSDGQTFYFASTLEDYAIELNAIPNRPQTCGLDVSSDPVTVFESLVSYMKTHYAFFDLYGVDWDASVRQARLGVSNDMSEADLFAVFKDLLKPLKDGHLTLEAQIKGKEETLKPGRSSLGEALSRMLDRGGMTKDELTKKMMHDYWMKGIKEDILKGKGKMVASEWIQYGIVSGDIGYVAISSEAGYAGKGLFFEAEDLAILQTALDGAISTFNDRSVKSVIIDLSINFGGYDFISREIAGRFATQHALVHSKFAADSSNDRPYESFIEPHSGERYTGPVVLITSDVTVSAGEVLTMALRTQPNVTHAGEPTRGALSDVLGKRLPNGWTLNLSNEVYYDGEGEFWEDQGIPPHIPLQIFNPDNPFEGHVEAVNTIVKRINQGEFK